MARRCRLSLRSGIEPSWESDSASDCSDSWDFGFASPAQPLRMRIHNSRSGTKKTEGPEARFPHRSVGGRRSSFPAIWIPLPHVDCFGSRRPRRLASSDAQICRLLRSCPAARWQAGLPAPTRETKIQWGNLLRLSQASQALRQSFGTSGGDDCRQRYLSSCSASQALARCAVDPVPALLLAAIQSRTQSDRTGLETDTQKVFAQSILLFTRSSRRDSPAAVPTLEQSELNSNATMRNYLRRYV